MPGGQPSLGREAAWPDLFRVFGASLVLVAVGVLFFTAVRSYRAISQTVEQVQTLMRNILQSIPTGGLTIDPPGIVPSLNSAPERRLGLRAPAPIRRPASHGST